MTQTVAKLKALQDRGEKFAVVAAYDASMTEALNSADIDAILVGDSLGMVVAGLDSTVPVTMEQMAYHTAAVARTNRRAANPALVIADLPFMSYHNEALALENATRLMQAGANMVKLEGGAWLAGSIAKLNQCGIPVCAHIGLTPQSVNKFGGYKVQGKSDAQQAELRDDLKALEQAGADFIVFECIPASLADELTRQTSMATIGIGAGSQTNAQVLVCYDMLGLSNSPARFVKNFLADAADSGDASISQAFRCYKDDVLAGRYPAAEHEYQ